MKVECYRKCLERKLKKLDWEKNENGEKLKTIFMDLKFAANLILWLTNLKNLFKYSHKNF